VLLPLVLLTQGLSWILASLGVYLRDVAQTVQIGTAALMFLSPIFYPASAIPEQHRYLLHLNPMTTIIEQAREVLIWGNAPDVSRLAMNVAAAFAFAWIGLIWFQRTRAGFADVL
jgi:lipopolysaccharide transport system permease protein